MTDPYDDDNEYDYDASDTDLCDHEDHDVDWDGSAKCWRCGERWYLTSEEYDRYLALQTAQAEYYDRMQRRERSRLWRAWWRLEALWRRLVRSLRRDRYEATAVDTGDEVPF